MNTVNTTNKEDTTKGRKHIYNLNKTVTQHNIKQETIKEPVTQFNY
jgi:hypothetical protein